MKLSKILENYIVIPSTYETIVRCVIGEKGQVIELTWTSDNGEEFVVQCENQEVKIMDQTSCQGMFSIKDDEGESVQFIALKEAKLEG